MCIASKHHPFYSPTFPYPKLQLSLFNHYPFYCIIIKRKAKVSLKILQCSYSILLRQIPHFQILNYRNYLNSMRKSSSIAIFLGLILFLAPFAEAETIQIINYIPRISGKGRKGQQRDRSQSLDIINNLIDNLKEVINSEFTKGSNEGKRSQEKSSECESQQKSQRQSTQSSLRKEKEIESKETKIEKEEIQTSKDTKIIEDKIQDVPKEIHLDNAGAQKIETTQLATNEPSLETKQIVHQAQKPTAQIKKQESTIEVKQDNKEEAGQKGSIIIQSSQKNVPKSQPLQQQQAKNHQVEVQQAKSAEILPQTTTIPQETSSNTASSNQVVELPPQKNENQEFVEKTASTAVEAEPENMNLIKTHQQPTQVIPEKNLTEQVKVIPLPVQQLHQSKVESTDSSKTTPDIQSYLTKAEPVTTLQIQIEDKKIAPQSESNFTAVSQENNDKSEVSVSTESVKTGIQQKEQEKEATKSVISLVEDANAQIQTNLTIAKEQQASVLPTDSVQKQIANDTQAVSSSNISITAESNQTENSQPQNQTQIVKSEKIQEKQVVSEPIAQVETTPVNTITSHTQVEPQIVDPITTLPVTPVKNNNNDQLLQEKEVVTQPAKEPSSSFMASICMPMCDYESSAPVCEHQRCRACQTDLECVQQFSIFEAHPSNFKITCDAPSGRCVKKEQEQ